jgi:DNA replication protein DnaC
MVFSSFSLKTWQVSCVAHWRMGRLHKNMSKLLRNDLIALDELGYIQLDTTGSDHLFQLVAKAYKRSFLIATSNLDFQDWGQLSGKPATETAFLDRLLRHARVRSLEGDSYRIRHRLASPMVA